MTIEEKAKAYDEAIERAKKCLDETRDNCFVRPDVIFPELKESEKEQNIKNLIDELKCSLRAANCQNDACGGGHEKRIALLEWSIAWLEKQGEQKPADEVEPKFKPGDWVIRKDRTCFSNGSISARVQRIEGHKIWLEHGTYVNEWVLKKITD